MPIGNSPARLANGLPTRLLSYMKVWYQIFHTIGFKKLTNKLKLNTLLFTHTSCNSLTMVVIVKVGLEGEKSKMFKLKEFFFHNIITISFKALVKPGDGYDIFEY